MITLITGAPGSGKSAYLVSLLLEISKGRGIYVDGIPDLKVDHQPLEDANNWHQSVPDGSIIVIDEVQRVWRPRGPGQKVPDAIQMLETHRHRGIDFYIITQAPRLVDTNVRALVGRHVHLRELGILGRWFYEWPECAENCAASWKNAPIKKRYRLPKQIFGQYKSASEHIKPIRSFPKMLLVLVVAVIALIAGSWRVYSIINGKIDASKHMVQNVTSAPGDSYSSQMQSSQSASEKIIDDRVDWIPRDSMRPESAPAYDHIRKVVDMPIVSGGYCWKRETEGPRCRCYTQQGTEAGIGSEDCERWLKNPPFNPYKKPVEEKQESIAAAKSTPKAGEGEASAALPPPPASGDRS